MRFDAAGLSKALSNAKLTTSRLFSQTRRGTSPSPENTQLITIPKHITGKGVQDAYYDQNQQCRYFCIAGLALSWAISIFCIIFGGLNSRGYKNIEFDYDVKSNWDVLKDVLILLQTAVLMICQESLGYIHTVSLRWALQGDGKLEFNSNLRLWQNAKMAGPNAWYGNVIVIVGQIATFGSSAMTMDDASDSGSGWIWFLGAAWITLGIGIGMQAAVATWALFSWRQWPTWSSDPQDVAAACLVQNHSTINARPGRALHGVEQVNHPAMSMRPSSSQQPAYHAHRHVKRVTWTIWAVLALCLLWAGVVLIAMAIDKRTKLSDTDAWNPLNPPWTATMIPLCCHPGGDEYINGPDYLWMFVLISALQAMISLATHCAELHVNLSRDEAAWREACSQEGHKRTSNALSAVLKSWQSIVLIVLKIAIQWFFGLTFSIDTYDGMYLYGPQTLYLSVIVFLLAAFATILVLQRPVGPQPTTFGHLQALVDLIDQWPAKDKTMFWGDKGEYKGPSILGQDSQGVRHAGTSTVPLKEIDMTAEYA